AGSLVVPFAVDKVDGVLERTRGAVVVLGRDEDERIKRGDRLGPPLRVLVLVAAGRRRDSLVEQRELVVRDIEKRESGVRARRCQAMHPTRDRLVVATGPCTTGHDGDAEHLGPHYQSLVTPLPVAVSTQLPPANGGVPTKPRAI